MKRVFISYRYKDRPRFDLVRDLAARLRFFSIEVIIDQRSLFFGEDIKSFMEETIGTVDALIILLSRDYHEALQQQSGPGEGVRFEVSSALGERSRRPDFRIIPVLLDDSSPIPPFDRLKCAKPSDIDQIVTELGLEGHLNESRVLAGRYRVDQLIEQRGLARIFDGFDPLNDAPVEIYQVPTAGQGGLQGERFTLFERVVKGRSMAHSPFLLNVRDTYINPDGAYYLVTEKFPGTTLDVPLHRNRTTHPTGALCIGYQVAMALYELHQAGVVHSGLAPRAIRLNPQRTLCKIVDFEFARPLGAKDESVDGFPLITPPERFAGEPASVQQDIYQLANLTFQLICGFPVVSRRCLEFVPNAARFGVVAENPGRHQAIRAALSDAVARMSAMKIDAKLAGAISDSTDAVFINEMLTNFLAGCLHPNPELRGASIGEILEVFPSMHVPPAGRLLDGYGAEIPGALFPEY
ncbi:MAG: TIR domain-containing protein [Rhodopirellula sp.]|nr:TIR domain-containing protein [Rhodopirellula sp.]